MRTVLLATLALLVAAPAASAATTVSIKLSPAETQFGSTTRITGTVAIDGVAASGQPVTLEGRPYPYVAEFAPVVTGATGPAGTYTFEQDLDHNWQFRVVATARGKREFRLRRERFTRALARLSDDLSEIEQRQLADALETLGRLFGAEPAQTRAGAGRPKS